MGKNQKYTEEFKYELIGRIDRGEMTKAAASREHNIAPSLIDRWRDKIHNGTMISHATAREKQLEKELDKYKKKVGEMTIQIDLLKKINETYPALKKSNGYIVTGKNADQKGQDVP
jgi:transposase-like protein